MAEVTTYDPRMLVWHDETGCDRRKLCAKMGIQYKRCDAQRSSPDCCQGHRNESDYIAQLTLCNFREKQGLWLKLQPMIQECSYGVMR